jgi:hypothetical protein
MCIDTAQANGLSLNANTSTASINFHIAKTLIGKILSTGLSITNITFSGTLNSVSTTIFSYISGLTSSAQTQLDSKVSLSSNNTYSGTQTYNGNISFTGTLNSMTTTIFSSISTAFGKQNSSNVLISTSTTLSVPFASIYTLTNGSNITITLPDATSTKCRSKFII